jgi:Fe2+ transport system protein FeoA
VIPLTSLLPGQRAIVVALPGGRGQQQRLSSMGLTVGAEVQSLISRGRGPIVVAVRQTRLALGRGIASHVHVRPLEG